MICKRCGAQFEGNFCPNCGAKYGMTKKEFEQRLNETERYYSRRAAKSLFKIIGITILAIVGLIVLIFLLLEFLAWIHA